MAENSKMELAASQSHKNPFKKLASMTLSRRRTLLSIVEYPASPTIPGPVSVKESTSKLLHTAAPKSRIPTPSVSRPGRTRYSELNALASRSDSISNTKSQIPRPSTDRTSYSLLDAMSGAPSSNQDGQYPSFHNTGRRRSEAPLDQQPPWHPYDERIHRSSTLSTILVPPFMSPTFSSTTRSNPRGQSLAGPSGTAMSSSQRYVPSGLRRRVPGSPQPLVSRVEPGRGENQTPTGAFSRNEIIPNEHEEYSVSGAGIASLNPQSLSRGNYSFEVTKKTVGLALTTPIPPGGDIIHESQAKTSQPLEFFIPESVCTSPETETEMQIHRPVDLRTEAGESETEDHSLPQMGEEDISTLPITTAQPSGYWLGRVTALSDRFRTEAIAPHSTVPDSGSMRDDRERLRRVFMHLHELCSTQVAKDSLEEFRNLYLEKALGDVRPPAQSKKTQGKKGVFEKLMGKRGVGK